MKRNIDEIIKEIEVVREEILKIKNDKKSISNSNKDKQAISAFEKFLKKSNLAFSLDKDKDSDKIKPRSPTSYKSRGGKEYDFSKIESVKEFLTDKKKSTDHKEVDNNRVKGERKKWKKSMLLETEKQLVEKCAGDSSLTQTEIWKAQMEIIDKKY